MAREVLVFLFLALLRYLLARLEKSLVAVKGVSGAGVVEPVPESDVPPP